MIWRERAVGAILTVLAVLLGLGLFSHLVPNENQFLGTLSRIADSMRPWLLILAILLSLALLPLRAWRSAAITCLVALTGLGSIAWDYRSRSVPWAEQADLRVLWFNVLNDNEIAPDRIETELRNSGAEIIVLTEAMPAYEMKDRLADLYPHVIGCRSQTSCPMMILSRLEPEAVEEERPTGPTRSLFGFTVSPEGHPPWTSSRRISSNPGT
ncbi:hypothetical protein OCH239_12025 [Roseivivax halodurans JCM 10272]|uniref:Endonuclease/exonuclease/phosphatase domain-containing protein n=1 Tax=Roseivivax halodurans JCM 10272 TaxID=1449350 RepID=X7ELE1_9RHOB|nr:hypothetical protein OCH239_12025 [Roseivivax halodurans JCM 10272]